MESHLRCGSSFCRVAVLAAADRTRVFPPSGFRSDHAPVALTLESRLECRRGARQERRGVFAKKHSCFRPGNARLGVGFKPGLVGRLHHQFRSAGCHHPGAVDSLPRQERPGICHSSPQGVSRGAGVHGFTGGIRHGRNGIHGPQSGGILADRCSNPGRKHQGSFGRSAPRAGLGGFYSRHG